MNDGNKRKPKWTALEASGEPNDRRREAPSHIDKSVMARPSPAFDLWLDRQLKLLFAAAETPPNLRLLELIGEAFPDGKDKITK